MKANLHILTLLTVIALAACSSDQGSAPPPEGATPEAAPAQEAPRGTSINVGEGGVEVNSDNGAVRVSPDSASIVLPK